MLKMLTIGLLCLVLTACESSPTSTPPDVNTIDTSISTGASLIWRIPRLGNSLVSVQPVSHGDSLFIVDQHSLRCLNATTGEVIWDASPQQALYGGSSENMIVDKENIIVLDNYQITSVNSSGKGVWSLPPPNIPEGGFKDSYFNNCAQSSDALFVTSWYYGDLFKVSKTSGAIIWRKQGALLNDSIYTKQDSRWNGCPVYSNGRVYVPGRYGRSVFKGMNRDGSVACFDAESGSLLWIKRIPAMDTKYSPFTSTNAIDNEFWTNEAMTNIIAINDNSFVFKSGNSVTWFDKDGNITWRSAAPDKHGLAIGPDQLRYWQNRLLVLDYKQGMSICYGVDPITHEYLWTETMSENSSNYHSFVLCPAPAYVGNVVYFISDDYWIFGIDVITGKRTYALNLAAAVADNTIPNQTMDGGFLVDKDHRIYIMDNKYIYCLQMTL
jgi:outer membrane protein assembly factor BamB